MSTMQALAQHPTATPSWRSAGIVDARAFSVGESATVHTLTHYNPNHVRAACGLVAACSERDGRLAYWRDALPDCPTCLAART